MVLLKNTSYQFCHGQFNLLHITDLLIHISYYVPYWLVEYWSSRFFTRLLIVLQNCYAPISIGRVVNYNVTKSRDFQSTCLISRSAAPVTTDEMKSRVEAFVCSVFPFHLRYSIQWGQIQGSQLLCFGLYLIFLLFSFRRSAEG